MDPTRLDPPIPVTVEIGVAERHVADIYAHLAGPCRTTTDDGCVVSREGEARRTAAVRALFDGRHGGLLLTHLDAEGRPTFALAPPPAPPG